MQMEHCHKNAEFERIKLIHKTLDFHQVSYKLLHEMYRLFQSSASVQQIIWIILQLFGTLKAGGKSNFFFFLLNSNINHVNKL